ncbi:non-ribosomal peptide synthetase [Plantactinospora mayteni]|uniref:Amino acid adenylation protein n=1 Tax=Plantactinospora mayteni TaxID=566021 RepID=A0ABQ4EIF5_9ACTN|nr:non-ribosomal peptide synthetase [Plantactinospora mayteni]GIG93992.1 amino acid adenylation protein [Plantactinospora mayteni]
MTHSFPPRIVDLVVRQVQAQPDATAVSAGDHSLTYRDLDRASDAVASRLTAAGTRADDVVAVLADRSPDLIAALLGILKAGAGYLVADPSAPAERLAWILGDAAPAAILTGPGHTPPGDPAVPVLPLTGPAAGPAVPVPIAPGTLAYVSYTSGSTGRPKGVAVPHDAVVRLVHDTRWASFGPDDVFLQASPVAFDASTLEIWAPLTTGGRLALHPPGPVTSASIAATVAAEGVTVLWLTAGIFHQLARTSPGALRGVRHLLAGGDVVAPRQIAQVLDAVPGLTFTNGYGPTENTTFTTCWTSTTAPATGTTPIGRPIDGTGVRVLDDELRPVRPGIEGRLWATGRGLARGYLGRPGLTAEKFRPDPWGAPGDRMYDTGDRVRVRADGAIEYLGRADQQVKIRGFRVEPGEIERTLRRRPEVADAAVIAQVDPLTGTRLVGYVVLAGAAGPETAAAIRRDLRTELPEYMIPAAVLPLDRMPLTANGKVDRSRLPAADRAPRTVEGDYHPPSTATEAELAEVWGRALQVEPIGVDDDFFELGGHSLLAAELVGELHRRFAVRVPARTLYRDATIRRLATVVDELRDTLAVAA